MIILGIDPGLDGGLAVLTAENDVTTVRARPMPTFKLRNGKREIDVVQLLACAAELLPHKDQAHELACVDLAVMELVHSHPKQGVVSMFTFGRGYGKLLGMLDALAVLYESPTPQRWKRVVLAGTLRDKAAAISYVQERYPDLDLRASARCRTPHDGMADAVCLAEYGRMLTAGEVARTRRKTTPRKRGAG